MPNNECTSEQVAKFGGVTGVECQAWGADHYPHATYTSSATNSDPSYRGMCAYDGATNVMLADLEMAAGLCPFNVCFCNPDPPSPPPSPPPPIPPPLSPPSPPPPNPPPPGNGWFWAENQETCVSACSRNGLLCHSKTSRDTVIANQVDEAGFTAVANEANANDHMGIYQWPGSCDSHVAQGWSPMPFFRINNNKCFSSSISAQNGEYGYRCNYVNSNQGHRLCKSLHRTNRC
jgi:hypothetical protein